MTWRWLIIVGISVLLGGCAGDLPRCEPPNQTGSAGPCVFLLTITKTVPEVKGHVAKAAVEANTFGQPKLDTALQVSKIRNYQFVEYSLNVSKPDKEVLMPGKDYLFMRKPGTSLLELIESDANLPMHENAVKK